MVSVLLFVFVLQLAIHIINNVGKSVINDFLWRIFVSLPILSSDNAKDLTPQRREVARLQRELKNTSAQDEFAKWAKLRRQHDKLKEQYEKQSQAQQSLRANFDRAVTVIRWLGTQGLNFMCNAWFAKSPMFWLPTGWVPYPVEWVLSLPRAPLGSVSINVWGMACSCVVGLVAEAIVGVWTLKTGEVKVGANKGEKLSGATRSGKASEKKEL